MSEFIKPEHECPFDPKQYECHCVTAPIGSFSWALIQLKLRKRVARSAWGDKGMYLAITPRVNELTVEEGSAYAVDGVAVGTKYDYLTHIDLHNEHGNFVPWQPTQEDMMACDWELKNDSSEIPESSEYNLFFDITANHPTNEWIFIEGNISDNMISRFYWSDIANDFSYCLNKETVNSNTLKDLVNKKLTVIVDEISYDLSRPTRTRDTLRDLYPEYTGSEAEKIGLLLKQTGKTFRFHFNWHD
ncbi:DUF2829 domain-containing protein [Xenorhabdus sp. Vera]|uniref:DUF2829 domain-containing protein n=1 Tax=Xenorhabdus koppenhoeferi TaxID=351659 RepID=UPI0019A517E8|nr:DUF2829 domain-containing protein [Xenorhabdus sp. Vera]MBD2811399.1 DUF2829 domain-containing protein [Xenorhabdus sp. Vera]